MRDGCNRNAKRVRPSQMVAIITEPRSGSSVLSALLGLHPEINSFWELFRQEVMPSPMVQAARCLPNHRSIQEIDATRRMHPGALIDELMRIQPGGRRVQVFKLFSAQTDTRGELLGPAHLKHEQILREIIDSPRPSCYIVLERRNTLAAYVSQKLAAKHNGWHKKTTAGLSTAVDVESFKEYEVVSHRWYSWVRRMLSARKRHVLTVAYEDLESDLPAALNRVLRFVGVRQMSYDELLRQPPGPFDSSGKHPSAYRKQATVSLESQIDNVRDLPMSIVDNYLNGDSEELMRPWNDTTSWQDHSTLNAVERTALGARANGAQSFASRVRDASRRAPWGRAAWNCGGTSPIQEACVPSTGQRRWYQELSQRSNGGGGDSYSQRLSAARRVGYRLGGSDRLDGDRRAPPEHLLGLDWQNYLVELYGRGDGVAATNDLRSVVAVDASRLDFFWSVAPGRSFLNATWACPHCPRIYPGTLWAPLMDAAFNRKMLEAHPDAGLCAPTDDVCFQVLGSLSFAPEMFRFPGFFMHKATRHVSAHFRTVNLIGSNYWPISKRVLRLTASDPVNPRAFETTNGLKSCASHATTSPPLAISRRAPSGSYGCGSRQALASGTM